MPNTEPDPRTGDDGEKADRIAAIIARLRRECLNDVGCGESALDEAYFPDEEELARIAARIIP